MVNVSDLIGISYRMHGRDENGLDCFGLIWLIAMRRGTPIPDVWYKGFDPALSELARQMKVHREDTCAPGCVAEIVKDGRLHLGYMLDNERIIHATIGDGVVVEDIAKYPVKGYFVFD